MLIRIFYAIFALFIFAGCGSEKVPPPPYDVYISSSHGMTPEEMEQAMAAIDEWVAKAATRGAPSLVFKGIRSDAYDYSREHDDTVVIYLTTRNYIDEANRKAYGDKSILGESHPDSDVRIYYENLTDRDATEEAKHGAYLKQLKTLIMHELGHTLGIPTEDHSANSSDVMFAYNQSQEHLTEGDLDIFCKANGC